MTNTVRAGVVDRDPNTRCQSFFVKPAQNADYTAWNSPFQNDARITVQPVGNQLQIKISQVISKRWH